MGIRKRLEEVCEQCLSLDWGGLMDSQEMAYPEPPARVVTSIGEGFYPLEEVGDDPPSEGEGPEGGMTPTQWVAHQRAARTAYERSRQDRGVIDAQRKRFEADCEALLSRGVCPLTGEVPPDFRGLPLIVNGTHQRWDELPSTPPEGWDEFWGGVTPYARYLETLDVPPRERVEPETIDWAPTDEVRDRRWGGIGDEGPTPSKELAE